MNKRIFILILAVFFTKLISAQSEKNQIKEYYYSLEINFDQAKSSGLDSVFIVDCVLNPEVKSQFEKIEIQTGKTEKQMNTIDYPLDGFADSNQIVLYIGEANENNSAIKVYGVDAAGNKIKLKQEKR